MKPSVRGKLREGFNTGMYSWSSWYTLLQLYYVPVLLLGSECYGCDRRKCRSSKEHFFLRKAASEVEIEPIGL